jgi:flagellin
MSLTINSNVNAIVRSLNTAGVAQDESMKRLSSGQRINSAKDDAAGLAIATRMQSKLQGMSVAQRNASDALSLTQAADAALGQTSDMMIRMKELATQSANATNGTEDQAKLDKEFQELAKEITRTIGGADFNGTKILAGGAGAKEFMVGADSTDTITVTTTNLATDTDITAVTGGDITSAANAKTAMDNIDTALDKITEERALYGATASRFESVITGLQGQSDALASAKGRIMDTDYATETAKMQKNQVLQQASMAMLSQANAKPQQVMQLLR